ncbi:MAG: flagellar hook capping FlgD N-terminal domain-containing protein [Acetobacteraceae bacterium]|nr:flagellar hook capping FlgD N-terminal domain-containing protein [Acetobacteraceae bacterium]
MTVSSTTPTTNTSSSAGSTSALTSLAGNFNDFLSLLTTQLQNQDPTSPMDTSQFTSQLVQFTGVAEQITANTTLTSILAANQTQQLSQANALVGDKVTFTGGTLPLQSGSAQVNYQTSAAEPVLVTVTNSSGTTVKSETVNAAAGTNTWTWDGTNSAGKQLSDGAYTVTVTSGGTAVPFQAVGTVTGAEQVNQAVQLEFGAATVPYSQIVSMTSSGG